MNPKQLKDLRMGFYVMKTPTNEVVIVCDDNILITSMNSQVKADVRTFENPIEKMFYVLALIKLQEKDSLRVKMSQISKIANISNQVPKTLANKSFEEDGMKKIIEAIKWAEHDSTGRSEKYADLELESFDPRDFTSLIVQGGLYLKLAPVVK